MKRLAFLSFLFIALFAKPAFSQNPTAIITSPTPNQQLSNVTSNGSTLVPIVGTANDTDFQRWELHYGLGANPSTWTLIASGTTPVINSTFTQWETKSIANQDYTIRLRVYDIPQHLSTATVFIKLRNFKMSQSVAQGSEQFNPSAGQTITYTSIIPFNLTQTLEIRNAAGQTVRVLQSSVARTNNTNPYQDVEVPDIWDGRNSLSQIIGDGPYFYWSSVTANGSTMIWDLSTVYHPSELERKTVTIENPPKFDPFKNELLDFSYNVGFGTPDTNKTAKVTVAFGTLSANADPDMCLTPSPDYWCLLYKQYQTAGPHSGVWSGADSSAAYRLDFENVIVFADRRDFAMSAVFAYGTAPAITGFTLDPGIITPPNENLNILFTVSTYLNQLVNVTVTIRNSKNGSTVRTISLGTVTPGQKNVVWDGLATNGQIVSPDVHLITVTATDSVGQQVMAERFTAVRY